MGVSPAKLVDCSRHDYRKSLTTDLKLAHLPTRSPRALAALPSISPIPSARFTDNADDENDAIRMTNDEERGKSLNSYPRQSATALARNRSIWRAELCDA